MLICRRVSKRLKNEVSAEECSLKDSFSPKVLAHLGQE